MNRGQIIGNGRKLIYEMDEANSHFQPADMIGWYEDWVRDIAMYSKWPRSESVIAGGSVIGDNTYPIDVNEVLELLKVYYKGKPIEMKSMEFLDEYDSEWRSAANDVPTIAYMRDTDVLGLYPPPNANGDEIRLRYVKVPTPSTQDSDVPDLSIGYHITGELFIAMKAHRSIGNDDIADRLEATYNAKKREIKGELKTPERRDGWDWSGAGVY